MAEQTHYRICPICEAGCGLVVTTDGDQVTKVRANENDLFSEGYICPKGVALKELHEDPDRLRQPLIKRKGGHEEISWDDAFSEIDARLTRSRETYGPASTGVYLGNPIVHSVELTLGVPALMKALKTPNVFSASSVDQTPKQFVCGLMYGDWLSVPVPDLDRADYLVILGGNPMASNGSLWTAPNFRGRLRRMQERGGHLTVIDPRRTETADVADEHHFIRPGTDAFFLAAVLNVIFTERLGNLGRLSDYLSGFDRIEPLVEPFDPETVARLCDLKPERIRTIARKLAQTQRAALYGRMGTTTQRFGSLTSWLVELVNIAAGNLDREGGAMFPCAPAFAGNTAGEPGKGRGVAFYRRRSRLRQLPEVMGELPAVCLAEEIETPGEGQIRSVITIAGNPVLSVPNGDRLARALQQTDFMLSVDIYLNETTRHADIILPGASPLEKSHYDVALSQFSIRNVARYSKPVFEIADGRICEWDILLRLSALVAGRGVIDDAEVLAMSDAAVARAVDRAATNPHSPIHGLNAEDIITRLPAGSGSDRLIDLALRIGPYGDGFGSDPDGLSLAKVAAAPDSIDLGPLKPRVPGMLRTPSGKIEAAPDVLVDGFAELTTALLNESAAGDGPHPLLLFGRRHVRSNNSWLNNLPVLEKGPFRCTLMIHPDDAAARGLRDGGKAEVVSARGAVVADACVTDAVIRGAVSLPHGWGHDVEDVRLSVAQRRPGVNVNILTDGDFLDALTGTAALNGVPVDVRAIK